MNITVSVLMSAYNHKDYVSQAIRSVLAQTFLDYEFLIADDHSLDGTDEVIRGYSDSRISAYYHKENTGGCIKFLFEKAVGKYITIIDSDDEWLPDKLEKQVEFMEAHPECAACFTHAAQIDENGNSNVVFDMPEDIFRQPNRTQAEWLRYFFTNGNCLCNPSVLLRKKMILELGNNRALRQLNDFYIWIQLIKLRPIHIVQEDLTLHRRHLEKKDNISFAIHENIVRFYHEAYCLSETYFDNISDVLFVEAFSKLFRNPQAHTPAELTCEKYFLLLDHWHVGGNARKLSAAVFFYKNCEDEDVLNVLKSVYGYTVRDYYELTGKIDLDWLNEYKQAGEYKGTVYFDTGSGFSENEKSEFIFSQAENAVNWNGMLPQGCKALRFDPIENYGCIVRSMLFLADGYPLETLPVNGTPCEEYVVFSNTDPQFLVKMPEGKQIERIKITALVFPLLNIEISRFAEAFERDYEEIAAKLSANERRIAMEEANVDKHAQRAETAERAYSEQIERAETAERAYSEQRERAETAERAYSEQRERAETAERAYSEQRERTVTAKANALEFERCYRTYQASYLSISNSTIWKISKPYRVCADWLKSQFKRTYEIGNVGLSMAWRHYRAYGMKATYKKIKKKLRRRHPVVVVPDFMIEPMKEMLPEKVPYTNATVSVVIPAKNAGVEYESLLKNIRSQNCFQSIELVIVDSGSTDDTLAVSRKYGAKIVEILPQEFSHSYSRNLGVENATGEFVCIMTQDALPTSNFWLYNLWRALMSSLDVAAVSCTEFPRMDSDLYYRSFGWNHYKYLGSWNRDILMSMPANGDADAIRRNAQLSDITCFIRRETLLKYQYRGCFAEDLDLGMRLISDGYRLAFLGTEQVIHSHNRDSYYYFRRRFVELKTLKEIFNDTEILPCAYTDVANQTVFLFLRMKNLFNHLVDDRIRTLEDFRIEFLDKFHQFRKEFFPSIGELGDGCWDGCAEGRFAEVLNRFRGIYIESDAVSRQYAGSMIDATEGYFNVVFSYMAECYELVDNDMVCEFRDCAWKIMAGVAGTFLAYSWFHLPDDRKKNSEIYSEAGAGI